MTAPKGIRGMCPDKGTCHHQCDEADSECFRVRFAGPLSGVFPRNLWPDEVLIANGIEVVTDHDRIQVVFDQAELMYRETLDGEIDESFRPSLDKIIQHATALLESLDDSSN